MSDSVQPHRWQPTRLPHLWDSPGKNTGVGCHFLLQCMKVKSESEVAQLCPTLGTPWTAAHQAPPPMGFSRQEYWSGVPLPSPNAHSSTIYNSQKMETTQVSINEWMDKQITIYPYNRVLAIKKNHVLICASIMYWYVLMYNNVLIWQTQKCHATWKKSNKKCHILYDSIYIK